MGKGVILSWLNNALQLRLERIEDVSRWASLPPPPPPLGGRARARLAQPSELPGPAACGARLRWLVPSGD